MTNVRQISWLAACAKRLERMQNGQNWDAAQVLEWCQKEPLLGLFLPAERQTCELVDACAQGVHLEEMWKQWCPPTWAKVASARKDAPDSFAQRQLIYLADESDGRGKRRSKL